MTEYFLIEFPEVQSLQEEPDFEDHAEGSTEIDGAYFVEKQWVLDKRGVVENED